MVVMALLTTINPQPKVAGEEEDDNKAVVDMSKPEVLLSAFFAAGRLVVQQIGSRE